MVIKRHTLNFETTEEDFWRLVDERQRIWYRRFRLKQQPPWTTNPLLERYKFTNCYRELDRGTQWAVKNIIKPNQRKPKTILLQTVAYRCLNRIETVQKTGPPGLKESSVDDYYRHLLRLAEGGETIFSSAYITPVLKGESRLFAYGVTLFETLERLPDLWLEMRNAPTLKHAWQAVHSCDWVKLAS